MPRGHVQGGVLDVAGLVVEEKVRLEFAQKLPFGQTAKQNGFVHFDVPVHERADGAFMGWGAAGGDETTAFSRAAFSTAAMRRLRLHLTPRWYSHMGRNPGKKNTSAITPTGQSTT